MIQYVAHDWRDGIGDGVMLPRVTRVGIHKDDDVRNTGIIGCVGSGHVGRKLMVEGAITGAQRNRDALLPLHLWCQIHEITLIAQILGT